MVEAIGSFVHSAEVTFAEQLANLELIFANTDHLLVDKWIEETLF